MWYPSHLELIQAGVVDKVVDYIPVPEKTKQEFSIQSYIDKSATHLNKTLPMDIDSETRADFVTALSNTIKYTYTMKTLSKSEINQKYLHTKFVTNIKAKNCQAKENKVLLENNANIAFQYNDKDGAALVYIEINKEECKKDIVIDYTPVK